MSSQKMEDCGGKNMPYKSEKIKLSESQDRRRKLRNEQKEKIKKLYETGTYSLNQLAKKFGVSKKTILLTVNPNSADKAKQYKKENWKNWQRKGEERNKEVREYRHYKQSLYLQGKLKEDKEKENK